MVFNGYHIVEHRKVSYCFKIYSLVTFNITTNNDIAKQIKNIFMLHTGVTTHQVYSSSSMLFIVHKSHNNRSYKYLCIKIITTIIFRRNVTNNFDFISKVMICIVTKAKRTDTTLILLAKNDPQ